MTQKRDRHKYEDYLLLADRHIKSCEVMLERLKSMQESDEYYKPLVYDTFYLIGYIVEGICVYCLYKWFGWDKGKYIQDEDDDFLFQTGITFGRRNLSKNSKKIKGSIYYIADHKFSEYIGLLSRDNVFCETYNEFPYIIDDTDRTAINLIKEWSPEIRYKSIEKKNYQFEVIINKDDIEHLLKLCNKMYDISLSRLKSKNELEK